MRVSLQFNLRAIVCQKLLASIKPGISRVPALEILINTPPVQKAIEAGEDSRIPELVRASREEGMVDFTRSLYELLQGEFVDREAAMGAAVNPQALGAMLEGVFASEAVLR